MAVRLGFPARQLIKRVDPVRAPVTSSASAVLAGTTAPATGSFTAQSPAKAIIDGTTAAATGSFTARSPAHAILAGTTAPATGSFVARAGARAVLAGTTAAASGSFAAKAFDKAVLAGTTAPVTGSFTATAPTPGSAVAHLMGTTTPATGSFTASSPAHAHLAGTAAAATGAILAKVPDRATLAGTTSSVTGSFLLQPSRRITLVGTTAPVTASIFAHVPGFVTSVDIRAYTIAQRLLDCALDRLDETSEGVPPRACVITGPIAWDNCQCGQLVVSITNSYTSSNFPTPSASTAASFGAGRCGEPLIVYNLTISMLRCVPVSDEMGNPPSCDALAASASASVEDASSVRNGILCCLSTMLRERDANGTSVITGFTTGNQDFVTGGMCGGSTMTVQLGVINFCPCTDS